MKILGSFIGVNRYASPDINDLTGAVKDAQVLSSLFQDTFEKNIETKLLTDQLATCDAIKEAIEGSLSAAGEDDIVLISFSGHGSRNHRLIAYDASKGNLNATSIPMEFLSENFKKSKAKIIICILDCCFSGDAPAKVFADTPATRDIDDPFQQLQGKGRILLAAANATQPAYERPNSGHGLLTEALVRVLKTGEGNVDVASKVFEIIDIVQAEAGRLGVIQTPVVASLIEGGLKFPVLKEGKQYLSLFPPERALSITSDLSDLSQFHIPQNIIAQWKQKFNKGLNALQVKAINEYKILSGESTLVVAPTSSGKTFVGELAAIKAIADGKKAVFLLPYKALVNEKYQDFIALYGGQLNLNVIRCSGDFSDQTSNFVKGKYDLAILTFEMFLSLMVSIPHVLNPIGLVVLDEAQFIMDPSRGINVELLLTCLLTAKKEKNIQPQLIALSAVIGGTNYFDTWLGLKSLVWRERPVPLEEGVIDPSGVFRYRAGNGNLKEKQLIPASSATEPHLKDILIPLVSELIKNNEKVIIFRSSRREVEQTVDYLSSALGLASVQNTISKLPALDQSATSKALRKGLLGGVAFHTANLSKEEREIIEDSFRKPDGEIKILVATSTVAAGINTPASTVIIGELDFPGQPSRAFTVAEYKNMAGRAGRVGYADTGKCIIYSPSSAKTTQIIMGYVCGQVEKLKSSFELEKINTWVIRLLAQVKTISLNDVTSLLVNTYGGYLATLADSAWPQKNNAKISELIKKMLSLQLLEQEDDQIQLTMLGRACANSALSFESSLRLVELIKSFSDKNLNSISLMALIQILQESDEIYTPISRNKGVGEPICIQKATERYGKELITAINKYAGDNLVYHARCKRASILHDWIQGISIDNIEVEHTQNIYGSISAGDIRRCSDMIRNCLRSAFQIIQIVAPQAISSEKEFDTLLNQLEFGLPKKALGLLELRLPLQRGEYLLLVERCISKPDEFYAMDRPKLIEIFGEERVLELSRVSSKIKEKLKKPVPVSPAPGGQVRLFSQLSTVSTEASAVSETQVSETINSEPEIEQANKRIKIDDTQKLTL